MDALNFPRVFVVFWISVVLLCHFRTWLFLGYSLKLPTPSLSQPTPPKEMVLAASPNWCPPLGQVTIFVRRCALNMFQVTIIWIFQMVWWILSKRKSGLWSAFVFFDIHFRRKTSRHILPKLLSQSFNKYVREHLLHDRRYSQYWGHNNQQSRNILPSWSLFSE